MLLVVAVINYYVLMINSVSLLGEYAGYSYINSMIEESKYCTDVMTNKDFENSTKCWICDNDYTDDDVKVRDHFHITGKQRGSAYRNCNINVKLIQKFPSYFTT